MTCSAISNQYIALASSTFVEEKPKKSKKKDAGDGQSEDVSSGDDEPEEDDGVRYLNAESYNNSHFFWLNVFWKFR